jgi:hypothetical protein
MDTPQKPAEPDDEDGFREHFAQGLISLKVPANLAWYWAACLFPRKRPKLDPEQTTFTITTPEHAIRSETQTVLLVDGPYHGQRLTVSIAAPGREWYALRTLTVSLGERGLAEYRSYNGAPGTDGLHRFYFYELTQELDRPCSPPRTASPAR